MKSINFFLIALTAIFIFSCDSDSKPNPSPDPELYDVKVIAHRGYFKGTAENSIEALNNAHKIGAYGSEFDVVITSDGVPVINHDDAIQGVDIQTNPYSAIKDFKLENGETLPTLEDYLIQGKENKGTTLILEIKAHRTKELEDKAVDVTLELVKKHKLEKEVEYISFSMNICKRLLELSPKSEIATLGDLVGTDYVPASPKEVKEIGLTGISYNYQYFIYVKPEWIKEAKDLGITVATWTVNDIEDMDKLIEMGVEVITTDKPVELQEILKTKVKK